MEASKMVEAYLDGGRRASATQSKILDPTRPCFRVHSVQRANVRAEDQEGKAMRPASAQKRHTGGICAARAQGKRGRSADSEARMESAVSGRSTSSYVRVHGGRLGSAPRMRRSYADVSQPVGSYEALSRREPLIHQPPLSHTSSIQPLTFMNCPVPAIATSPPKPLPIPLCIPYIPRPQSCAGGASVWW